MFGNLGQIAGAILGGNEGLSKSAQNIMDLIKTGGDINGDNKVDINDAKEFVLKLINEKGSNALEGEQGSGIADLMKNLTSGKIGEFLSSNNSEEFNKIKDFLNNQKV